MDNASTTGGERNLVSYYVHTSRRHECAIIEERVRRGCELDNLPRKLVLFFSENIYFKKKNYTFLQIIIITIINFQTLIQDKLTNWIDR